MTTPTVYTKPGCFPCKKTIGKFQDAGIEPHVVDLTETPAALDYVSEELGYSQAPIVVIDDASTGPALTPTASNGPSPPSPAPPTDPPRTKPENRTA